MAECDPGAHRLTAVDSRTQAAGLAALLPNPLERSPGSTGAYRTAILGRMDHRGG